MPQSYWANALHDCFQLVLYCVHCTSPTGIADLKGAGFPLRGSPLYFCR